MYDQAIINEESLIIPHPGILERAFVIKPLAEINADEIEPNSGKNFAALLNEVDTSQIKLVPEMEIILEAIEDRQ